MKLSWIELKSWDAKLSPGGPSDGGFSSQTFFFSPNPQNDLLSTRTFCDFRHFLV
jgi:hypothetical protein